VSEVTAAQGLRFARAVAERMGARDEDAERAAELLVRAELGGHPSHGLRRLPQYAEAWRKGTLVPSARAEIVRDDGSTLTLDGRQALGQVVCTQAADLAARRALEHGVAAVAVRHSGHAGRFADYADRACEQGAALLAFANDSGAEQTVAPPGGLEARLSTNPLAAGIPRPRPPHLVIDLATSVAAFGKVRVLQDSGQPIPDDWMRHGLLRSLGGVKGFALALLVEALSGVVSGAGAACADPGPDDQGVFLLAFDPRRFGDPAELAERLDAMLAYVLGVPLEAGAEPLRAPGSGLSPLPLDPDARFQLAPALAARLEALAVELGAGGLL
jgi:uncharacterized oxidoreductase